MVGLGDGLVFMFLCEEDMSYFRIFKIYVNVKEYVFSILVLEGRDLEY